jgi:hypothetical protein
MFTSSERDFSEVLVHERESLLKQRNSHPELHKQLEQNDVRGIIEGVRNLVHQIVALGLYLVVRVARRHTC